MDNLEYLKLLPTEAVVFCSEDNCYIEHAGGEITLYLTNLNIVCLSGNPKKRKFRLYKYPLNQVKIVNGNLQMWIDGTNLKILLTNGLVCFEFEDSKSAKNVANRIKQAIVGDFTTTYNNEIEEDNKKTGGGILGKAVFGVTNLAASVIKSGVNGLKKGFGISTKSPSKNSNDEFNTYVGNINNQSSNTAQTISQEDALRREERMLREEREYKLQMARIKNENNNSQNYYLEQQTYQHSQQQRDYKFCTNCGNKVSIESKFCSSCGNSLS